MSKSKFPLFYFFINIQCIGYSNSSNTASNDQPHATSNQNISMHSTDNVIMSDNTAYGQVTGLQNQSTNITTNVAYGQVSGLHNEAPQSTGIMASTNVAYGIRMTGYHDYI